MKDIPIQIVPDRKAIHGKVVQELCQIVFSGMWRGAGMQCQGLLFICPTVAMVPTAGQSKPDRIDVLGKHLISVLLLCALI